ncbi:hypothetical protein DZA31_00440 [Arcobacter sp. HD9-500m-PIT-SAG02]|nr:hypothetical protein DZA31_00440 [Arcobacter sp. HD9-500m-PIT-SAG02]
MVKNILLINLILITFIFTGCELNTIFGPSNQELDLLRTQLELKEKELKFNQLLQTQQLEQAHLVNIKKIDAKIANDIALNSVKKELELARIQSTLEKEKYELQKFKLEVKSKEKNLEFDLLKQENNNTLSSQKYLIAIVSFLIVIFTYALFTYFNNKRKDKLRAYQDNLSKYFQEKENKTKIEIASKILDTIVSGKLSAEQENRLISSLSGDSKSTQTSLLNNKEENKVEIIHDMKSTHKN